MTNNTQGSGREFISQCYILTIKVIADQKIYIY